MNSDHKKSIFAILKSYHQYKIHNRALVKNFKHNYRALKAELRDSNSELSQAMVLAKKTCDSTPESCRQAFNQLVRARFEAKMNPQSISWINYFLPSAQAESSGFLFQTCTSGSLNDNGQQNDLNFHALFFGALDYTCESRDFKMKIYGPGLSYEGLGMFGMACSSDQGGNNVGLIAGASLGIGVKTALTIGDSGICTLVGLSAGVGAYAGVAVMKMK